MSLELAIYRILWTIAPFPIKCYLRYRAKKNSDYLLYWNERFGKPLHNAKSNIIWLHAVSVGEMRAALPIIQALNNSLPERSVF